MPRSANIQEIFTSIQGEGLQAGQLHIFIRFFGCHLDCSFCDTPSDMAGMSNPTAPPDACRIERKPNTRFFEFVNNPLTTEQLLEIVIEMYTKSHVADAVALTGGEPLLQVDFLREFLPRLKDRMIPVLLETSGDLPRALNQVIDWVDVVSMDIKLPSSTGMEPLWEKHRDFIQIAKHKEFYAKAVVTGNTSVEDVRQAAELLEQTQATLILQPAAPIGNVIVAPSAEQLFEFHATAHEVINSVRVMPQLHRMLNVL